MRRKKRAIAVVAGLAGGAMLGYSDPALGAAWGGIFGVVFGAFAGKMLFG